jgi:hypothetical protein
LEGGPGGASIDIMEKPWLDGRVQHTLHWDGYGKDHKSSGFVSQNPRVMEEVHTFSLLWLPDEYVFYIDGKQRWRSKAGDIRKVQLPDDVLVDYVRVYDLVTK